MNQTAQRMTVRFRVRTGKESGRGDLKPKPAGLRPTQHAQRTIAGLPDYSISVVVYSIPPVKRTVMLYSQAPNAPMIKPTMR